MKYLLVLAVLLVAVHIWRSNRRERPPAPPPKRPRTLGTPEAMARCAHCGMHLPAAEAVAGRGDAPYCSAAHRELAEG